MSLITNGVNQEMNVHPPKEIIDSRCKKMFYIMLFFLVLGLLYITSLPSYWVSIPGGMVTVVAVAIIAIVVVTLACTSQMS